MAEQQDLGFWKFRMLMDKNISEDVPWVVCIADLGTSSRKIIYCIP